MMRISGCLCKTSAHKVLTSCFEVHILWRFCTTFSRSVVANLLHGALVPSHCPSGFALAKRIPRAFLGAGHLEFLRGSQRVEPECDPGVCKAEMSALSDFVKLYQSGVLVSQNVSHSVSRTDFTLKFIVEAPSCRRDVDLKRFHRALISAPSQITFEKFAEC